MTIYIVRHGETVYNAEGKLQGWFDTPLTDKGIASAHELAKKLLTFNVNTVISSDLGRAFMTAYLISRDIGYSKEIVRSQELREVSFGDLSGMQQHDIDVYYHHLRNALTYVPPHGEALEHMQTRVLKYVRGLATHGYDEPILLVVHDCVINALYAAYAGLNFGSYNTDHTNPHDVVVKLEINSEGKLTGFTSL